jgi:hypothetical protein
VRLTARKIVSILFIITLIIYNNNKMDTERKINLILSNQKKILSKLDNIEKSCKNMDNHISFIEIVYESLKTPLRLLSNIRLPFYSITESNSNR